MRAGVSSYVRCCITCTEKKIEKKTPANRPLTQSISFNFVCPLPCWKHGNTYILEVTNYFSRFVVLFPCRSATLCNKYMVKIFIIPAQTTLNVLIKTVLRSYVQQHIHRTSEDNLSSIAYAIRTSRLGITGHTPYFINFGWEHRLFGTDARVKKSLWLSPKENSG